MEALQASMATPDAHSTFSPLTQLPNEIVHQIFHLQQVAKLRLACKAFSEVGLQYLVPQVHLIFKSSSFKHLREISEHPVLSQHVQSLLYEADSLTGYDTMKEWKTKIIVPGWFNASYTEHLLPSPPQASERKQKFYNRRMDRLRAAPRSTHSRSQLKLAYQKYRKYLSDQNMIRHHEYNAEMIWEAMVRLRRLKRIELSLECCLSSGHSLKKGRAFGKAFQTAWGDGGQAERCGIAPLRTLLLGASHAGLEIETLCCGSVHWRFFQQDDEIFNNMKHAVRCLRTLYFDITTATEQDVEVYCHMEIPLCADYLKRVGRLHDFTNAMPHLEDLTIRFDYCIPKPPAQLPDIVGNMTWHALRITSFTTISVNEQDLVQFYTRHASTLREIGLNEIRLTQGAWPPVFKRIRKILSLEKATISGRFTSDNPREFIYFGLPPESMTEDDEDSAVKIAVEKYLVEGGEGPLIVFSRHGWEISFTYHY